MDNGQDDKDENWSENANLADLILVPDNLFLFKTLEAPHKYTEKKVFDVIFSQVVECSPLPIDHLAWGYFPIDAERTKWLWYSGLKDRIQSFIGSIERDGHVIPCAIAGILCMKAVESCLFVYDKWVSVIVDKVPKSFFISETSDLAVIREHVNKNAASLPMDLLKLKSIRLKDRWSYCCALLEQKTGAELRETECTFSSDQIWQADIRDKAFIKTLREKRRLDLITSAGVRWSFAILAIVFVLQLMLWGGKIGLAYKHKTSRQLAPVAKKIENKNSLVKKMQSVFDQEVRPFELLGLLNSYRPKEIYFVTAAIDNKSNIVVNAVAETAVLVDDYVKALRSSDYLESVLAENIVVSDRKTKFKLSCSFKKIRGDRF